MDINFAFLWHYGQFGGTYLAAAGTAIALLALGLVRPFWVMLPVVLLLGVFSSTSVSAGLETGGSYGFDVYGKGAGYLFFSLFELAFLFVALSVGLKALLAQGSLGAAGSASQPVVPNPLAVWYGLWAVLLLGWALHYAFGGSDAWLSALSRSGVLYIALQGAVMVALVGSLRDERDLRLLLGALALAVGLRMLWGVFRYFVLGGDPVNYYAGIGNNVRITFWDINDSILAATLACALIWLAATGSELKRWHKLALMGMVLCCLAVAALSARRSGQGGIALALLALWWLLPRGRRWWVGGLVVLLLPMIIYKLQGRLEGVSVAQSLFSLQPTQQEFFFDPRRDRFHELNAAWATVRENLVFGVGPAGRFNPPSHVGLEYHQGRFSYVHSGFVHVWLKTGLLGLLALVGLLLAWARLWWRQWRQAPPRWRAALVASMATVVASLPTLAFGTPFIELRTSLLMGLGLCLPMLVATAVARQAALAQQPRAAAAPSPWRPGALHRARMRHAFKTARRT